MQVTFKEKILKLLFSLTLIQVKKLFASYNLKMDAYFNIDYFLC